MKKIFIGIDFSKEKFDATAIFAENLSTQSTKSLHQTFKNTREGFKKFMAWVAEMAPEVKPEDILVCGENTGIYSELISTLLDAEGYTMWLESALKIKRSMGLQRLKSDKADSAVIAEYAMRFQDKAVAYKPLKPSLKALNEIFKQRAYLVRIKKGMQVRAKEKCSTEMEMDSAMKFIQKSAARVVKQVDAEIKNCDKRMQKIIDSDEELKATFEIVTSIKGVALQNGTVLLVVTNNFKNFDFNARKLACYYGVAPFGKDSGTSVHVKPHTSCFADTQIKSLLSEAARCAVVHCTELKQYYQRLIARGKKKMVALNNVKNKMLHMIVAMVKSGQKYNPNHKAQLALQYEISNN